jgi:HprK-related kinase A
MAPTSVQFGKHGLYVKIGPFIVFVRSNMPEVNEVLSPLYEDFPRWPSGADLFPDFHVGIQRAATLRRWLRPQVVLDFDGVEPFAPLRADQAPLLFEGGLNWLLATQVDFYFSLHAAVIERGGRAVVMPGAPGAGKSTLCAILVNRGWRLLSDEFALISFNDGRISPLARPISLKNRAIDVVRDLAPDCVLSRRFEDTLKGTVALLKPPRDSVGRMDETANPAWVIMPKYLPDVGTVLEPKPKTESFMELITNAYNYHRLGRRSFTLLADLVDRCDCYDFRYSEPEEAVAMFDRLANTEPGVALSANGLQS